IPQDPWDVVIRALCCPPPEVLKGQSSRARRLVPGAQAACRWWDLEFFPLQDDDGLLCVLGKISAISASPPADHPPVPETLVALRERVAQRYALGHLDSGMPALRRVVEQVRLAGQTRVPVLILGERGTGKHWIVRTIHHQGLMREGTFVAIPCDRLPL